MFLSIFLVSLFVVFGSFSPVVGWVFMELVTYFFIPLIVGPMISFSSIFISWKYFLIQGLGSFLFFLGICVNLDFFPSWMEELVFLVGLMIKLGVFPHSAWVFHVSENMNWVSFVFFSSIMKIIPLIVLLKNVELDKTQHTLGMFVIISSISVVWLMMKNFSIRILLTISSAINMNWMLLSAMVDEFLVIIYLLVYSFLLFGFSFFFSVGEELEVSGIMKSTVKSKAFFLLIFTSFMMGLPPFGVFFLKAELTSIFLVSSPILMGVVILSSSISSFLYLKILIPSLLGDSKGLSMINFFKSGKSMMFLFLIISTLSVFFLSEF